MYDCPNCGGSLTFDIASQMLHCAHCGSYLDPYEPERRNFGMEVESREVPAEEAGYASGEAAEDTAGDTAGEADSVAGDADGKKSKKEATMQVTVFTCPACGAEIASTNLSATGFCTYCGASAVFEKRVRGEKRPKKIIPFKKTKEDCKKAYSDAIKSARYVPKELTDPEYLDRFVGVYMPYWNYEVEVGPELTVRGKKTYTKGKYEYTDHYALRARTEPFTRQISFDASSAFDDHIHEVISPYGPEDIRPFTPGYLAGFYSDVADVPKDVYLDDAEVSVGSEVYDQVEDHFSAYQMEMPESLPKLEEDLSLKTKAERAMFPVWFLTWRKGDRVAYSVVNGQTGKVYADLPADLRRFSLFSILLALPVFLFINLFLTVTAPDMLTISSVFAVFTAIIYWQQMGEIKKQETRSEDAGYLSVRRAGSGDAKKLKRNAFEKRKQKRALLSALGIAAMAVVAVVIFGFEEMSFLYFGLRAILHSLGGVIVGVCLVLVLIFTNMSRSIAKEIREVEDTAEDSRETKALKSAPEAWGCAAAVVFSLIIFLVYPVRDHYYYIGSAAAYILIFLTIIGLIRKFNLLATRPVPEFHGRTKTAPGGRKSGRKNSGNNSGNAGSGNNGGNDGGNSSGNNGGKKASGKHAAGTAATGIFLSLLAALFLFGAARTGTAYAETGIPNMPVLPWYTEKNTLEGYVYQNPDTGYRIYMSDGENLLDSTEETLLLKDMQPVTKYGNTGFVSGRSRGTEARWYAEECYQNAFGTDTGTMFVIDMDDREIRIHSDGELYKIIGRGKANTITDNVYHYASIRDYYMCAKQAFVQILMVLEGQRIAQPMKYLSNAILSLLIALLLNFWVLRSGARKLKPKQSIPLVFTEIEALTIGTTAEQLLRTTKTLIKSSSGGGGGSRGGGGGFSGGGHSGGGGGHRF